MRDRTTPKMQDLKTCIKKYRMLDDQKRELNKTVNDVREHIKIVELEMADILRSNEFDKYKKLRIEDDGSMIKIQRPSEWNKAWNLSKKDLQTYLEEYFQKYNTNAQGCFEYILERHKEKLVGTEFTFVRVIPSENVENM